MKPAAHPKRVLVLGASESMLWLNPETSRYDAEATPSYGSETLFDFLARLVKGEVSVDRGEHAVF